ncbi:MAG: hypothetical protein AB7K24_09420 [Gemmataceae bacterium]
MALSMPECLARLVAQEMKSGRYATEQVVHTREREETLAGIREGLADWEAGQVQSVKETFADVRSELGIARDS